MKQIIYWKSKYHSTIQKFLPVLWNSEIESNPRNSSLNFIISKIKPADYPYYISLNVF
jgi:hypothetical protein